MILTFIALAIGLSILFAITVADWLDLSWKTVRIVSCIMLLLAFLSPLLSVFVYEQKEWSVAWDYFLEEIDFTLSFIGAILILFCAITALRYYHEKNRLLDNCPRLMLIVLGLLMIVCMFFAGNYIQHLPHN